MAFEAARQKIAALMGPLQLQELQQRLKQMQQPQQAGVVPLPGGGRGGVTFNPADSAYSIQTLVPGAPPEPKFPNLKAAAAYYLEKGDFEKLKLVNDEITKTEPPKPGGYTDTKTDTSGRLWGFNKDSNKYELIETPGAKFPTPKESVDPNAAFDRWQREQEYKVAHPTEKPQKPIPPDVLNMLKAPIPKSPTAEQSRRLADAADRVFGGTGYKQDLITRGRRSPLLGLRSPYEAATYDSKEYADTIKLIQQAVGHQEQGAGSQKPDNATHTGIGSMDHKKHWLDANGADLGLAE